MSTASASLLEFLQELTPVNGHAHLMSDAQLAGMDFDGLLRCSYLNWQFKNELRSPVDYDRLAALAECNSYFFGLDRAFRQLYGQFSGWREIKEALEADCQNPVHSRHVLQEVCRYQAIVLDDYHRPGWDNGQPDLYRPALRSDMFVMGHAPKKADENGNTPYACFAGREIVTLADYEEAVYEAIRRKAQAGICALKIAVAYERGLDFAPASPAQAGLALHADANDKTKKAFEDYMMFALCRAAGELGLPVQIHTGMGKLEKSGALELKRLVESFPGTKFVLLHCSYPWTGEVMALLHEYRNVYADISWLPLLSPTAAAPIVREALEVSDTRRLSWGCDAAFPEESLGALLAVRETLSFALGAMVERGYYSLSTACRLCEAILCENPKYIYRLA